MNGSARPLVIGVGNTLLGDDGVGVALVEDLAPEIRRLGADTVDGGTGGFGLIGLVEDRSLVIFVDAVEMGLEPGDVHAFGTEVVEPPGDAKSVADAGGVADAEGVADVVGGAWSGHEIGLAATIALVERVAPGVRVRIIGVEPASTDPSPALSPPMTRRYPLVRRETWKLLKKELQTVEVKA